jgi:Flp pilus assembly protein TadB
MKMIVKIFQQLIRLRLSIIKLLAYTDKKLSLDDTPSYLVLCAISVVVLIVSFITSRLVAVIALVIVGAPLWKLASKRAQVRRLRHSLEVELPAIIDVCLMELLSGSVSSIGALKHAIQAFNTPGAATITNTLEKADVEQISADNALIKLGQSLSLPYLTSLGMAIRINRLYGASLTSILERLADDIRARQKQRLMQIGHESVNRVLVPAALFILLPFIGILIYPALVEIMRIFNHV